MNKRKVKYSKFTVDTRGPVNYEVTAPSKPRTAVKFLKSVDQEADEEDQRLNDCKCPCPINHEAVTLILNRKLKDKLNSKDPYLGKQYDQYSYQFGCLICYLLGVLSGMIMLTVLINSKW